MPKFNRKSEIRPEIPADRTNLAGGRAFGQSPELEFASMLLTSFVSDQFYRKEAKTLERVSRLLDEGVYHEFAAKAAIYARDQTTCWKSWLITRASTAASRCPTP